MSHARLLYFCVLQVLENKLKKPLTVWIIDDEESGRLQHQWLFSKDRPDVKVISFECLSDASQYNSEVDYIFIDLSAIEGRTIPCFDNHSYIRILQHFVEKHRLAFIVIMGALISHAEEDVEDIKVACPDVRLFALDSCSLKNLNPLVEFVNKYSPLSD